MTHSRLIMLQLQCSFELYHYSTLVAARYWLTLYGRLWFKFFGSRTRLIGPMTSWYSGPCFEYSLTYLGNSSCLLARPSCGRTAKFRRKHIPSLTAVYVNATPPYCCLAVCSNGCFLRYFHQPINLAQYKADTLSMPLSSVDDLVSKLSWILPPITFELFSSVAAPPEEMVSGWRPIRTSLRGLYFKSLRCHLIKTVQIQF